MTVKNLLVTLFSLLLMLALAEGLLQLADYPRTPAMGWRWDESPYRAAINTQDHGVNQLGLRGREIAYDSDDFVVLLVGDSQTEAGTQPADRIPEHILNAELAARAGGRDIRVFSIASAGWGQDQQLVWLRRYFQSYRADLVLNWMTPVNDYWENTFVDRSITAEAGRLKPTFRIASGDRLEAVMPPATEWKLVSLVRLALGRATHGPQYTLEQMVSDAWQAKLPAADDRPAIAPAACPADDIPGSVLLSAYLEGSRDHTVVTDEDVAHGRSHFTPFLAQASSRDAYAVAITHRLMREMARLSATNNADFYLFHAYRSDLDAAFREIRCVKTQTDGHPIAFDGSDWLRHLKQSDLKERLLSVELRSAEALNAAPNDWHFSDEGNRRAMSALAELLLQRGLVPGPGQ
jgi:hypothetical protein